MPILLLPSVRKRRPGKAGGEIGAEMAFKAKIVEYVVTENGRMAKKIQNRAGKVTPHETFSEGLFSAKLHKMILVLKRPLCKERMRRNPSFGGRQSKRQASFDFPEGGPLAPDEELKRGCVIL